MHGFFVAFSNDPAVGADGYDLQGYVFAAVGNGRFDRMGQTAAARDGHTGDGNGTDSVISEEQGQFVRIVHPIQLGTAARLFCFLCLLQAFYIRRAAVASIVVQEIHGYASLCLNLCMAMV